jgi:hypothetical protein
MLESTNWSESADFQRYATSFSIRDDNYSVVSPASAELRSRRDFWSHGLLFGRVGERKYLLRAQWVKWTNFNIFDSFLILSNKMVEI